MIVPPSVAPPDVDVEEMTPTLRGATALWLLMTRGPMMTAELACELRLSISGAWRTMQRLALSRRFPVIYIDGHWAIYEDNPRWKIAKTAKTSRYSYK